MTDSVSIEYEYSSSEQQCIATVWINGKKWYVGTGATEKEALESVIQNMAHLITDSIARVIARSRRSRS